jgi:hypothetical protein
VQVATEGGTQRGHHACVDRPRSVYGEPFHPRWTRWSMGQRTAALPVQVQVRLGTRAG